MGRKEGGGGSAAVFAADVKPYSLDEWVAYGWCSCLPLTWLVSAVAVASPCMCAFSQPDVSAQQVKRLLRL